MSLDFFFQINRFFSKTCNSLEFIIGLLIIYLEIIYLESNGEKVLILMWKQCETRLHLIMC